MHSPTNSLSEMLRTKRLNLQNAHIATGPCGMIFSNEMPRMSNMTGPILTLVQKGGTWIRSTSECLPPAKELRLQALLDHRPQEDGLCIQPCAPAGRGM